MSRSVAGMDRKLGAEFEKNILGQSYWGFANSKREEKYFERSSVAFFLVRQPLDTLERPKECPASRLCWLRGRAWFSGSVASSCHWVGNLGRALFMVGAENSCRPPPQFSGSATQLPAPFTLAQIFWSAECVINWLNWWKMSRVSEIVACKGLRHLEHAGKHLVDC